MKRKPIMYLIIDTSSSNEYDSGGCDYCLAHMTAEYISYLLGYMDEVRRLHRADNGVYSLECFDGNCSYFQLNDRLHELRDVDGNIAADVCRGEPILLRVEPRISEADFQQADCRTVQILSEHVWWTACVKHTNIRIESAHVEKKTLLRILRSFGGREQGRGQSRSRPIPPSIRRIHDLLYLDIEDDQASYDPDKPWDADTISAIAEIVAEFIPRPKETNPAQELQLLDQQAKTLREQLGCSQPDIKAARDPQSPGGVPDGRTSDTRTGHKNQGAKDYPMPKRTQKHGPPGLQLILTVSGGVADVLFKPAMISVAIYDYDVDSSDENEPGIFKDPDGHLCHIGQWDASEKVAGCPHWPVIQDAMKGRYYRTWKCPDCGQKIEHSYEALADVGSPYCPDCDSEMQMV